MVVHPVIVHCFIIYYQHEEEAVIIINIVMIVITSASIFSHQNGIISGEIWLPHLPVSTES